MNSAPISRLSWGLTGVGLALSVAVAASDSQSFSNTAYLIATVQVMVFLGISAKFNKPDKVLWPALFIIAVASSTAQLLDEQFTNENLQAIPKSLFLLVQVTLALGLLLIIRRRIGNDPMSVLGDGLIVALGAWFLIWVIFLQPTFNESTTVVLNTGIQGVTLAISAIVLFSLATLLFGDAARTPSVWLIAFAITFTTAELLRSASHRLLPRSLLPFVAPKPLTIPLCWAPSLPLSSPRRTSQHRLATATPSPMPCALDGAPSPLVPRASGGPTPLRAL